MAVDYKQAGVDTEAGDALVDWLRASAPAAGPHRDKQVAGIGGFAALFKADFRAMQDPCLVSCTDGVGTKVKLAVEFESYAEVAQDLVAMCVNDLVCVGAEPLFFLDYYASGRLRLDAAKSFLSGVRAACDRSGLALIGGETAEMPGVYHDRDFDCAGFAVGVVDQPQALGAHRVRAGDRLLGLASSGFHSNGFSLLRRVFADDLADWRSELLAPTALYPSAVKTGLATGGLRAVAHVTGGGLDNLPRALPEGLGAEVSPWVVPEAFREVHRRSQMSWAQMLTTLNCGVGMIWVTAPERHDALRAAAEAAGHRAFDLGRVVEGFDGWRLADSTWEGQ